MWQRQLEVDACVANDFVPFIDAALTIADVIVAQAFVDGCQRALFHEHNFTALNFGHLVGGLPQHVVILDPGFLETALETHGEVIRGVGGKLLAEKIDRYAEMKVQVPLDGGEIEAAVLANVIGLMLVHDFAGA